MTANPGSTSTGQLAHQPGKAQEPLTAQARPARKSVRRGITVGLLVLGLALLGYAVYWTYRTYQHVLILRDDVYALRAVGFDDLESVGPRLAELEQDVALIHADLEIPLTLAGYLGWLPVVGGTVEAAPVLFDAGETILGAVATTWRLVEIPARRVASAR